MRKKRSLTNVSVLLISLMLVGLMITSTGLSGMYNAAAQSNSSSNLTSSTTSTNSSSSTPTSAPDLVKKMQQLLSSNDPTDIATLAYIYGFPLVAVERTADFTTSPNLQAGPGRGPLNTISNFRDFPNASFTDIVRPNVDTLYSTAYLDLSKEPLVLKVPTIADRYYSLQFIDAYSNNFLYIGSRMNDTRGGTYLVTGSNWQGTMPSGMKQIKAPTNSGLIGIRILVNGPDDVSNVHSIQDQFILSPLSVLEGKGNSTSSATTTVGAVTNASSKEIPVAPDPALIPKTGVTIYDEISSDMATNLPSQNDSAVIAKFKTIGIAPGLTPS